MEKQKDLYLVRGLPGAGKTTFVKSIIREGDVMVAADDFMVDEKGKYAFDAAQLEEVHDRCAQIVFDAMQKKVSRIFVHNTFTEKWEVEKYYALAQQHSYRTFSLIMENRHRQESTHGTPPETTEAMRKRFEIEL